MSKTIGFIGNFMPKSQSCFSTECERVWSLEQLGHKVITFQENKTTAGELLDRWREIDLLLYSHTHDPKYIILNLERVFKEYKDHGIPTASVHLDRYAWLEREKDFGKEASFFTEYYFSADGSPESIELFKKTDQKFHWLKAGVVERACYIAETQNKLKHEIVFTGSRNYHKEYDFRPRLIDWLKKTYGRRFEHYGKDGIRVIRQSQLNNLYANTKIVIGDSCFGGRPRYVSDRYYEVRGRGGFLLHPHVAGIDTVGVGNYKHNDFDDLKKQIDYYLTHNEERETMRIQGQNFVQENETYTQRMAELLDVIYA